MVLLRMSQEADYLFQAPEHDTDLRVIRFEGREGLSRPFHFNIELASLDSSVDFDGLVGKPGLLTILYPDGERLVNGRILSFEQTREGTEYTYYQARLTPLFWFLKYRRDCRIFQKKTVREIVDEVLRDAGVPSDQFRFALQKTYEQREYTVQYHETDYAFVSRLLEEEGIFYFFEHSRENHVMVMGDSPVAHLAIDGQSEIAFREPMGMVHEEDYISQWRFGQRVRSGAVTMRDFDFKQPQKDLETNETGDKDTSLEVYEYPGIYEEKGRGRRLSKARLEYHEAFRKTGWGQTMCRRLIPGYRFSLKQHPRPDFNREYVIHDVRHEGHQPEAAGHEVEERTEDQPVYAANFSCLLSDQTYRPPLKTPKPTIKGSQTAIVVGPSGEEIHTDEHGRIKVQFHWDREGEMDENSSCWIRVSQGWAGGKYGMVFLPRVGQEVIVDFLEGDPDRPIVIGRVYNGDLKTPYDLPDEKTKSTIKSNTSKGGRGYNEIRFEDKQDQEQIFVHAQKDHDLRVENDRREWIGNDRNLIVNNDKKELVENNKAITVKASQMVSIGGDSSLKIKGDRKTHVVGDSSLNIGGNQKNMVTGDRSWTVGGNQISYTTGHRTVLVARDDVTTLGGTRNLTVGLDLVETIGISRTQQAGANHSLKAGVNVVIEAGLNLTIKAAGGFISINPMGVQIVGTTVMINSGGVPGVFVPAPFGNPENSLLPDPPQPPQEPDEADDARSGKDKTFTKAPTAPEAEPYQPYVFPEIEMHAPDEIPLEQSKVLKQAAQDGRPFCAKCGSK
jgi:type VI secretion system secreted protein VgrG